MLTALIKKLVIHWGPLSLIRAIQSKLSGPGITFIYGHRVLPDDIIANPDDPRRIAGQASISEIEETIKTLSKHYNLISIDDAMEQINSNNIKTDSVVLTFDDGFQDNFIHLLPVLKKYNVPAIFYINTSVISSNKNLWFQEIINYFFAVNENETYIEINDTHYDLSTAQKRFQSAFHFMRYIQANHPPLTFDDIISTIAGDLALPSDIDKHLTWEDLTALCNEELITLGAHTNRHYPLTLCDSDLSNSEISESKRRLEEKLPIKINHFSFPRGHAEDFNDTHIQQIINAGFSSAVSTIRGVNRGGQDKFRVKRVGLPHEIIGKTDELIWDVAGLPQLIISFKKGLGRPPIN